MRQIEQLAPQLGGVPTMGDALPDHRPAGGRGEAAKEIDILLHRARSPQGAARDLHRAAIEFAQHARQLDNLLVGGQAARYRPAILAHMAAILIGRKTDRPSLHAFSDQSFHLRDFRGRRGALRGFLAHDELTHGAVSHERGDIDAEFLLQPVKIFREAGPFPFDRLAQHLRGHRLDPNEAADHVVAVFRAAGASDRPQLPGIRVVTPWKHEDVASGSHSSWASMCV